MTSKDYKKIVVNRIGEELKQRGYRKSGSTFYLPTDDLIYFIGLQSSQSSTSTMLKLTVNIEIASSVLSKLEDTSLPEKDRRHYVERIGFYLDNPADKWWMIENNEEAGIVAAEIIDILINRVLPRLLSLASTNDLVSLWRQGKSPGLTDRQRKKYLSLFDTAT